MIQAQENSRLVALISAVVAVLVWAALLLLHGLLKLPDFLSGLAYLGGATGLASLLAVFAIRRGWRTLPFARVLSIPDLSGRWEGWTFRSLTKEWRPSAQEVTQRALDIAANAWGPDNWSRGLCASLVRDRLDGTCEFVWSYKTQQTADNMSGGDSHQGTHFLRLTNQDGKRYLEGTYVTDRMRDDDSRGSYGLVKLVWVSSELKHSLAYDENQWPMKKPH